MDEQLNQEVTEQQAQETAETQELVEENITEESAASTDQQETEAEEGQPERKTGAEKRIGQLTAKIYDLENRNKIYENILAKNTQNTTQATQATQEQPELKEPNYDDFDTQEEYTKAFVKYQTQQIKKDLHAEMLQNQRRQKDDAINQKLLSAYDKMSATGFEKYGEKFYDMANVRMNQDKEVVLDLLENPKCPEILEYLYNNPDIATNTINMSPYQVGKLIGDISAKLSFKKPASVTKAPKPIKPVGASYATDKSVGEMSQQEFEKAYAEGKFR